MSITAQISPHVLLHHLLYERTDAFFAASGAPSDAFRGDDYSWQDGDGSGRGPGYGATHVYAFGDQRRL